MFGFAPRLLPLPEAMTRADADRPFQEYLVEDQQREARILQTVREYSEKMRQTTNRRRTPLNLKVGEWAWVSDTAMGLKESRSGRNKLSERFFGPYRVTEVIVDGLTFRLAIPPAADGRVLQNIFPVKHLREGLNPTVNGRRVYDPPGRGTRARGGPFEHEDSDGVEDPELD